MKSFFQRIQNFFRPRLKIIRVVVVLAAALVLLSAVVVGGYRFVTLAKQVNGLQNSLSEVDKKYNELKNQDQIKVNQGLRDEIKNIHDNFDHAAKTYEKIVDLRDSKQNTSILDAKFAQILSLLSNENYASAASSLAALDVQIQEANQKLVAASVPKVSSVPISSAPPSAGFSQQQVQTEVGTFVVDIIGADLSTTKVIVDTASDADCSNNCPVLPLATYVARSGAFAGINGSFFCPATYPTCAGKTNSFDTLLMNKNKVYFNSANNVYSTVPAVIFLSGSIRFVSQSLEWGRDTSPDGVVANYPLLVRGGSIVFGSSDDPKFGSKGPRCFVANKGNTVYIGCVLGATMSDSAQVMKSLGMENALNLDEGGSTALWWGGYKLGPGRDIPNAILFVKK